MGRGPEMGNLFHGDEAENETRRGGGDSTCSRAWGQLGLFGCEVVGPVTFKGPFSLSE